MQMAPRTKAAGIFLIAALGWACKTQATPKLPTIVIGCKDFPEQRILQAIIAQHLRHERWRPFFDVAIKAEAGLNLEAHAALLANDIDLYVEYTGTAFALVLNHCCLSDRAKVLETVREEYRAGMDLEWLDPLGFDDAWQMFGNNSAPFTLSAAAVKGTYQLVVGPGFLERPDGFSALMATYPIRWFAAPRLESNIANIYAKLTDRALAAGDQTDPPRKDLRVVADDKRAFLPYQACIVVRRSTLSAVPGLSAALNQLSSKITQDHIQTLTSKASACDFQTTPLCYQEIAIEWAKTYLK
jgi:osmoprotectant transport system substrate-binding protein